ncbi:4Fe-4S-binding domain protein [Medicago truncatula]|uniref:4Fe-4S-binding domain protein n=1 Tax=Medicago truncatula TaxID=3880 RepID=G7JG71_MEDTR|nr:4Fe-4S-binding domain protein [Medicago truncatula]
MGFLGKTSFLPVQKFIARLASSCARHAARYIDQSFMIILSHANRLPVTFQYPYEKLITSERFLCVQKKQFIDFEICIFCGNCIEYCPTNCLSMTEEYELSQLLIAPRKQLATKAARKSAPTTGRVKKPRRFV